MLLKVWIGTPFSFFSQAVVERCSQVSRTLSGHVCLFCSTEESSLSYFPAQMEIARFLLEFNHSFRAVPGSFPCSGRAPFPEPEHLQSQFWNVPWPKQNSEMINGTVIWQDSQMNSAIFSTQFVIHHTSETTECWSDYSSGSLLFLKECFCPVYMKYA